MKIKRKNSSTVPEIIGKYLDPVWRPLYILNKQTIIYKKGEVVMAEGSRLETMGFVISGKLKIASSLDDETEHISRLVKEGDIVGIRAYGNEMIFPASAIALSDCELEFIPMGLFDKMLQSNSQFCYYFMMIVAKELQEAEQHLRNFSRMEMLERLALTILNNLKAFGYAKGNKGLLAFTLSRKDYSSLLGTTYETVVRRLAELEKQNLIRLENKDIRILKEAGLRKLIKKRNGSALIDSLKQQTYTANYERFSNS